MNRGWILFVFALVVTAAAAPFLGGGNAPEETTRRTAQPERQAMAEAARHRSTSRDDGRRDSLMGYKERAGRPVESMTSWTPDVGMAAPAPELTAEGPRKVPPRGGPDLKGSAVSTTSRPSDDQLAERIKLQAERRDAIRQQQEEAERRRREALERRGQNDALRAGRGVSVPVTPGSRGGSPINRVPMASSTLTVPTGATAQLPQGFQRIETGSSQVADRLRETLGSTPGTPTGTNTQGRNNSNLPQAVLDRLNDFFGGNFTGGSSGSGGGSTTGGSTTGGGPTVTTGSGGASGPAGSSGQPVGTIRASARWIPVDNSACAEDLSSYRTNDLFIRAEAPFRIVSVQMGGAANDGLSIAGGDFYQHPAGSNTAPSAAAVGVDPCIAFDSYLAIGDAGIAFVPTPAAPSPEDWGVLVQGGWFTIEMVNSTQNTARFGDSGHYIRVARLTAPSTLTDLRGEIAVTVSVNNQQQTLVLPISFCSDCWRADFFDVGPSTPSDDGDDDGGDGGAGGDDGGDDGAGGDDGSGDGGDDGAGGDDGSGDGGDDGAGDDDGADDGSGDDAGDDAGDDEGDDDSSEDDDETERVRAIWFVINNTCDDDGDGVSDLAGLRTADLYIRTDGPHRVLSVVSGPQVGMNDGISVFGGSFWQHPLGSNVQATPVQIGAFPCLAFDSWLSLGSVQPGFLFEPNTSDWGTTLQTLWFVAGDPVIAQRNSPVTDGAYYVRLGRFTVESAASVLGELEVGMRFADEASARTVLLEIPDLMDVP